MFGPDQGDNPGDMRSGEAVTGASHVLLVIPGHFNIDTGLAKTFRMPYKEGHSIQIRWESFNLTNTALLGGLSMSLTSSSTWGRLSSQRNTPRQMQFALRYSF